MATRKKLGTGTANVGQITSMPLAMAMILENMSIDDAIDAGHIKTVGLGDDASKLIFKHKSTGDSYGIINGHGVKITNNSIDKLGENPTPEQLGSMRILLNQSNDKYLNGTKVSEGDEGYENANFVTTIRLAVAGGLDLDFEGAVLGVNEVKVGS